jgi:hypothetical protein
MRSTTTTPAREATHRVMMEDIHRINAGAESRFSDYCSFIPSDLVTAEMVDEAHARGHAVVIVDEHENITVLPAPDPSIAERESDRFWSEILAD